MAKHVPQLRVHCGYRLQDSVSFLTTLESLDADLERALHTVGITSAEVRQQVFDALERFDNGFDYGFSFRQTAEEEKQDGRVAVHIGMHNPYLDDEIIQKNLKQPPLAPFEEVLRRRREEEERRDHGAGPPQIGECLNGEASERDLSEHASHSPVFDRQIAEESPLLVSQEPVH